MLPKVIIHKNRNDFYKPRETPFMKSSESNGFELKQQLQKLSNVVMGLTQIIQSNFKKTVQPQNKINTEQHFFPLMKAQVKQEGQERFKQVVFTFNMILQNQNRAIQIKKFIADVASHIFSLGFYYFQQGRLNQRKYKLFCCHNLLANIIKYSQTNKLTQSQLQQIDNHLKNWVLSFLKSKYPQSESAESNLKLQSMINRLDNMSSNSNDLLLNSKVVFEKKQSGDYSKQIMTFLNYIINLAKQPIKEQKSLYNLFYQDMEEIFTKVQDQKWLLNSKQGKFDGQQHLQNFDNLKTQADKQKYKQKVREYTKYLIGKKISDNVPLYSNLQIKEGMFKVKNPGMMRVLTKWCDELQKIFDTNQSIRERDEMFVMRDGTERYLSRQQKIKLSKCLDEQKQSIDQFLAKVKSNIYQNQFKIISDNIPQNVFRQFCSQKQSIVGYATSIMAKSNQNYLIHYLNKLIDCILNAQQKWMIQMNHKSHYKQQIPSLMTFKIGDLLRCKCSSKQSQITALFAYLVDFCQKNPQKLQMVRVKNRLSQGTKDILINFKYMNRVTTEMQLSINQDKSNFIKCSDKANHFIYELERASFGPISQLSSVCFNVDERSNFFYKIFQKKNQWKKSIPQQEPKCKHKWEYYPLPIWCSQCQKFNTGIDLLTPHKKCIQCKFIKCSKCIINDGQIQQIPIIKDLNWKQFYEKFKKSNEQIAKLQIVDLQKKQKQAKILILLKEEDKTIIFQLDQQNQSLIIQREIKTFKEAQIIKKIQNSKQIIKIFNLQQHQKLNLLKFTKEELFKINLNTIKINKGKIFVFDSAKIEHEQIFQDYQIPSVKRISLMSTSISDVKFLPSTFPGCEIAVLNNNTINDFQNINKWNSLKHLHLQNNKIKVFPKQIQQLKLQTLNMRENLIQSLGDQICSIKTLNFLNLDKNKIKIISPKIGELIDLQFLWLKQNEISQIPQQLGKLHKLNKLVLDQNKIQTLPKSLKNLVNLTLLNLNYNKLSQLPQDLFENMQKLQGLWIFGNNLSKIPTTIKNLKSLTRLSAFKNQLKSIPQEISTLKKIQYFNISNNHLQNVSQFQNLKFKSLIQLRLNQIQIKNIPNCIFNIKSLKSIYMYGNPIQQIPSEIKNLRKLQQLNLAKCKLKQLPKQLCQLRNLIFIDLAGNKLEKIPQKFGNLIKLERLNIEQNSLKQFSIQLCDLYNLTQLHAGRNLYQSVPPQIRKLKKLKQLTIWNEKLTHLPQDILKLEGLIFAEANKNILDQSSQNIFMKIYTLIINNKKKQQNY